MSKPALVLPALILAMALCLAGCAKPSIIKDQAVASHNYEEILADQVKAGRLYSGPATQMLVKAVALSAALRQAQVEVKAAARGAGPKMKAALKAAEQAEHAKYFAVVLSFYTPEFKWNNLDAARPAYHVFLKGPGGLAPAVDRRKLTKSPALMDALYPFKNPWGQLYYLKFARNPALLAPGPGGAKSVTFVITGPTGKVELKLPCD